MALTINNVGGSGSGKIKIPYSNYKPSQNEFVESKGTNTERALSVGAFTCNDNNIYILSGWDYTGNREQKYTWRYNIASDTIAEMRSKSYYTGGGYKACTDGNFIYTFNGMTTDSAAVSDGNLVQKYNVSSNSWTNCANQPFKEGGCAAVCDRNRGIIHFLGYVGYNDAYYTKYNIASNTWTDYIEYSAFTIGLGFPDGGADFENFGIVYSGKVCKIDFATETFTNQGYLEDTSDGSYTSFYNENTPASDRQSYVYLYVGTLNDVSQGALIQYDAVNNTSKLIGTLSGSFVSGASSFYNNNVYHFMGESRANDIYNESVVIISIPSTYKQLNGEGAAQYQFDKTSKVNGVTHASNEVVPITLPTTIEFLEQGNLNGYIEYNKDVKNI